MTARHRQTTDLSFELRVSGRPKGKQRPKPTGGRPRKDPGTRDFEERLGWLGRKVRPKGWPLEGVKYELTVVSWYPDRRFADSSNILKIVEDGLEGVMWKNDKAVQVTHSTVCKLPDIPEDGGIYIWSRVLPEMTPREMIMLAGVGPVF